MLVGVGVWVIPTIHTYTRAQAQANQPVGHSVHARTRNQENKRTRPVEEELAVESEAWHGPLREEDHVRGVQAEVPVRLEEGPLGGGG